MSNYAVLIDGGFIKKRLGSQAHPFTAEKLSQFLESLTKHDALLKHQLHRVYFYDAAPLTDTKPTPLGGDPVNYGITPQAQANKALHAALVRVPFVALRMGELSFRGWALKPGVLQTDQPDVTITRESLRANIQQKGVDMRIGLDIAALTLKKLAQIIVLVTADSDFVPAMKFARREGAQLFLVPFNAQSIKESMREHSDLILELNLA